MNIARVTVSLVVLALSLAPAPAGAAGDADVTLSIGQHALWDGEDIDQAAVASSTECGKPSQEASPCWDYTIEVRKEGASRLRVGLGVVFQDLGDVRDWPDFPPFGSEMIFRIELYDPEGALTDAASTSQEFTQYATEVFAPEPSAGTWSVLVVPTSVRDLHFRMRAKLEGEQNYPPGILSPNLRTIPPFEFSFNTPAASLSPGLDTGGGASSCMAEERADAEEEGYDMPPLCLRYSMGLENAGIGRFMLKNDGCPPGPDNPTRCYLHQRRFSKVNTDGTTCDEDGSNCRDACLVDGTCVDEPPGTAGYQTFHAGHGHFHVEQIWSFQLFRVVDDGWRPGDPQPELGAEGPGRKLGIQPTNELMADWHRFYQADSDSTDLEGENPEKNKGADFELPPGWGDAYEWNRGGNYSGFPMSSEGEPKSGYYLLLGTTDPEKRIIESNESDNVSYALIEVGVESPFDVDLLERGYGTGPWDASKVVLKTSP